MRQERVRNKASETEERDITDWEQTLSTPRAVIIYHPIILIPLLLNVQLSVETMTHNTTITSQTRRSRKNSHLKHCFSNCMYEFCCAVALTVLALLGLGHGRPVPGPLKGKNLGRFWHLCKINQATKGTEEQRAYMFTPGMPGPMALCGGLIPPPKFWKSNQMFKILISNKFRSNLINTFTGMVTNGIRITFWVGSSKIGHHIHEDSDTIFCIN